MSLSLPFDHHDHVLAAAAWSRLAEPADRAAAALVGALGPGPALTWLLEEAHDADGVLRAAPPPPRPVGAQEGDGRASAAWARAAARWAPRLASLEPRRDLDVLERLGGSLLLPGDPWWPTGLDELEQPPFCLWVRGDPALLARREDHPSAPERAGAADTVVPPGRQDRVPPGPGSGLALALVGSRASTRYGEQVAREMARTVARAGAVVVSGGAFGIDAAAHTGALRGGRTVGVCAGGVDRLYPAGNTRLLEEVLARGALVAEVPPGCQPARHRFLSRNRLIAAMTEGTVVVEAAWRSGALSTARHARDLGRPLGAVPGPVASRESVGCHRLLREGAVCVTDADDALELITPVGTLDPDASRSRASDLGPGGLLDGLDPCASAVLDAMPARGAAGAAALARSAGLGEREVRSALGLLELAGRVRRDGERWRRAAPRSA
ncbi:MULTISPECIES: DNA-processing protein DprA [unclassified Actinomyces]|uniref:DNA-processing protein DprA n=1 Tax=unclassified Actinomyces TaxID=2609248 RepID=UPI002017051D|nr:MULTISPECIES: DNA-processing protein DprA [unclassified Actinomyces]MCL3778638.1 DNA-protecting protein DprA [Actinomyces sp. AC-20-1]MCL3790746.1 DNA-protecting protein DprA [Actinomyces sp. 187325]MCL3793041.1 DNA-protecting protein DprA [Actinomyces sp. 186855]MCL3795435.1 DNA-protecting protein DprA [Actinomyces sp. 217892]